MKIKFLLLFALLPIMAHAQITQVTEEQKQQALQHVSKFCNLLMQWSAGQRTLDTQIYALCSGKDCSAYDDVSANKETSLRNYLLGIQKKYPNSLTIQISKPSLSNCKLYYEPKLVYSDNIANVYGNSNPAGFVDIAELEAESYQNAYIVFNVSQTIPSIRETTKRLIVYDVNVKKITAYVTGQGTFTCYLEGLNLMIKKEYKDAITMFDAAALNNRSSLKTKCYSFALMSCMYLLDFSNAFQYAKLIKDPFLVKYFEGLELYMNGKFSASYDLWMDCIFLGESNSKYSGFLESLYMMIGGIYALPEEMGHHHDIRKSTSYFKKSAQLGNVQSAWILFDNYIRGNLDTLLGDIISTNEIMDYLKRAAEKGHPAAILAEGQYEERTKKNYDEAKKWYAKGANAGDPFCMACLGKLLINSKNPYQISQGRAWLKKAMESDKFDVTKKAFEGIVDVNFWPKSKADIQSLIDYSSQNNSSLSNTSSTMSSSTMSSSTYQSNTYSTATATIGKLKVAVLSSGYIGCVLEDLNINNAVGKDLAIFVYFNSLDNPNVFDGIREEVDCPYQNTHWNSYGISGHVNKFNSTLQGDRERYEVVAYVYLKKDEYRSVLIGMSEKIEITIFRRDGYWHYQEF